MSTVTSKKKTKQQQQQQQQQQPSLLRFTFMKLPETYINQTQNCPGFH